MKYTSSTPRANITVAGLALSAISPYAEGHVLAANEAAVLNQTLAENLRNNYASVVKKVADAAEKAKTEVDLTALQADFDKYMAEYDFGVRRTGTRILDPIEKEAYAIATDAIKKALKAKGFVVGDKDGQVAKTKFEEMVETLSAREDIRKEAARRVKNVQSIAGVELGL